MKTTPLCDGFPPASYDKGDDSFKTGNFRFDDNHINDLGTSNGFSDAVAGEHTLYSMTTHGGKVALYIARVESRAELDDRATFVIKSDDAVTLFEDETPKNDLSVFVNKQFLVDANCLLQFFFKEGHSNDPIGRLDIRPGVLAFLQQKSGQPYIDISLNSHSRLDDIVIRLSAKPVAA